LPRIDTQTFTDFGPFIVVTSDLGLAAFYLASVILAMNNSAIAKLLSPFASIGRMTLTNYLCQSLICTTLMYSYGFGLYGRLRPLDWLALTLFIYAAQLLVSVWWLRRFAFGPAERLWRTLVFGKRLPMRLHTSAAPQH